SSPHLSFPTRRSSDLTRLPLRRTEPRIRATAPFTLVVPTYGFGRKDKVVPPQVIRFLNDPQNRKYLTGVVGAGNRNFNQDYCLRSEEHTSELQSRFDL